MPTEELRTVVDRALHNGEERFTLYQIAEELDTLGYVGMARALKTTCRAMEDSLAREYPLPEQLTHD